MKMKADPLVSLTFVLATALTLFAADPIAHWPLHGDARDHSGHGHHGTVLPRGREVDFDASGPSGGERTAARFDGRDGHIEVNDTARLNLGATDFSISVWAYTDATLDDVIGDIVSKYDPVTRRGFVLGVKSHAGMTSSQSNDRHLHFGIDNARIDAGWRDCGRPGKSILPFSMVVYRDKLYVGTCEPGKEEAGHVYRYAGGEQWVDCGSPLPANAVTCLAVHLGQLYAAVSRYRTGGSALADSPNLTPGGRVYRYAGGARWIDCGKLGDAEALNGMVVYRGRLYVSAMYSPGLFRYEGGTSWKSCGSPNGRRVESLAVYNGHIYATGYDEAGIYRYDGKRWEVVGKLAGETQTYAFAVYRGSLHVSTWPGASVYRFVRPNEWENLGRLGDEREVMGLAVYNGKLYAGTLPLAHVYRYDGVRKWTSTGRLDLTPDVRYRRVWNMAVYRGRLYAGVLPSGRVLSLEAGKSASSGYALAPGWRHIVAIRRHNRLELWVDGARAATSPPFVAEEYDLSNDAPLQIGYGTHDYFNGRVSDVRLYGRALTKEEVIASHRSGKSE